MKAPQTYPQWVVCAALKRKTDGLIVAGPRHYDNFMREIIARCGGHESFFGCEQGFIDQRGNFLTREEAHEIAKKNGQIAHRCGGDAKQLFSENLY